MATPQGRIREADPGSSSARRSGRRRSGGDLVNEPMIRHWCEVMGDENPVYTDPEAAKNSLHGGIVAPPTMLQTWILARLPDGDTRRAVPDEQAA